jgi:hypothetical protein
VHSQDVLAGAGNGASHPSRAGLCLLRTPNEESVLAIRTGLHVHTWHKSRRAGHGQLADGMNSSPTFYLLSRRVPAVRLDLR